jgi:endonuclease/exonuclease/phosphatase (EEP) superfamily protein YafD
MTMSTSTSPIRTVLGAVLLATVAAGCSDTPRTFGPTDLGSVPSLGKAQQPGALAVYTQNVYLGGDTGPLFSLDFSNIPALIQATNLFWNQVTASDPAGRAAALVDRIAENRPHLVGLQEVFEFRVIDFTAQGPQLTARVDLLGAIQNEIDARVLPYEIVAVQANTTTGSASGLPLAADPNTGTVTRILQFTDRIAVLRRTDVDVTDVEQANYQATYQLGPLTLSRGWIRVTTDVDGETRHFVNTHLESQALAPIQAAQAQELILDVTAGLEGVTILGGDLNSDAANPGAPSWTPTYDALLAAGFTDAWAQSGQPAQSAGYTCCQDPDLRNGTSLLDERIDFVLLRSSPNPAYSGLVPGSVQLEIVADEYDDRTDGSGLWPSDHAGLIATLGPAFGLASAAARGPMSGS